MLDKLFVSPFSDFCVKVGHLTNVIDCPVLAVYDGISSSVGVKVDIAEDAALTTACVTESLKPKILFILAFGAK